MDHDSDNFTAEMVLKAIGAEVGAGGTTAAGAAIVTRDLAAAGIPLAGVRIVDGSGLSRDDRVTARALVAAARDRLERPRPARPLWAALPVAGVSGTLEHRLLDAPARGVVRAKTGTTDIASALSGYVARPLRLRRCSRTARPCRRTAARTAQDRFATALASSL